MGIPDFLNNEIEAKFNFGISHLQRLDYVCRGLIVAAIKRDYDMQYRFLKCFFKEMINQTEPFKREKKDGKVIKTQEQTEERKLFIGWKQKADAAYKQYTEAVSKRKTTIPKQIIQDFDDAEYYLRDLMQEKGLDMPKKGDARYAMGG